MVGHSLYPGSQLGEVLLEHQAYNDELLHDIVEHGYDSVASNVLAWDRRNQSGLYLPDNQGIATPKVYKALDQKYQVETLGTVANLVEEVGLGHMKSGLLGYMAVSKNVYAEIEANRFEDSNKLKIEVPIFAGLAYDGVLKHMYGQYDEIATQWQSPMYSWLARHASPGVSMWHFWRGHIPDLPKVLLLTGTTLDHRKDFYDVDHTLYRAIPDVMEALSIKETKLTKFAAKLAMRDVCMLRDEQWQSFEELHARNIPLKTIRETVIHGPFSGELMRLPAQAIGDAAWRGYNAAATRMALAKQAA